MASMTGRILIVDDNTKLCETLAATIRFRGYKADWVHTVEDAKEVLLHTEVDVMLLDVRLGDESGLPLLEYCTKSKHAVSVVMITAFGTIELAMDSMRKGAFDFIQKPIKTPQMMEVIERALKRRRLNDVSHSRGEGPLIVTRNHEMRNLIEKIEAIAATELPVLICGETGVGKELIAEHIHRSSARRSKVLSKVNCAALSESLLDNELFGHEKGAYTGADRLYQGIFEQANGSTVFLDELGDMSLAIQAKILRTIQNREIRRLGGNGVIHVNVRFLGATNKSLEQLMESGEFRRDLYFRLSAGMFNIPSLRERREDIAPLAQSFVDSYNRANDTEFVLGDSIKAFFQTYHWPGNVRELQNVVSFACALSRTQELEPRDLPPYLHKSGRGNTSLLEKSERQTIAATLREYNYNKAKAAKALGISRTTLYAKMEKYGIVIKARLE